MSVKSESYNDAYSAEQKKSLDKAIAERAERIDGIVAGYLPKVEGFPRTVCEAMAYSVEAGRQAPEAYAYGRNIQDAWRQHRCGKAVYGSDRDDTYIFSHT